jgi:hypothetical protein
MVKVKASIQSMKLTIRSINGDGETLPPIQLTPVQWKMIGRAADEERPLREGEFHPRTMRNLCEPKMDRAEEVQIFRSFTGSDGILYYELTDDGQQVYNRKQLRDATLHEGNSTFKSRWDRYGLADVLILPEKKIVPDRQFRYDWIIPECRIAIEIQGGIYERGRKRGAHIRPKGYEDDCLKNNLAIAEGWTVFTFTTGMLSKKRAEENIEILVRACVSRLKMGLPVGEYR